MKRNFEHSEQSVRAVTRDLYQALLDDVWPSPAAEVDFGIVSPRHLGALQHAVKFEGVTLEQLDAALGNGEWIQRLISESNPYRPVVFRTDWDKLPVEPELD